MSDILLREEKPRSRSGSRFTPGRLLSSCALAAVAAMALQAAPAQAQDSAPGDGRAFNGTPEAGAFTHIQGDVVDRVVVDQPRTQINWVYDITDPNASNFVFLDQGETVIFQNNSGNFVGDYLVINRILATQKDLPPPRIDLLGDIASRIFDGETTVTGGRIWFYSPGGILVGPEANIDVGSLLLTANNPVEILDGGYGTGVYDFAADAGSVATVTNQGSISATGSTAYVAMIAPRVVQRGFVETNGVAAYVAAERVESDIDISGSLFDMRITEGTSAGGTVVSHTGNTIVGAGGSNVVFAAIPKNDAITMLVSGRVGYAQATDVLVNDGRIVLAAGYDIQNAAVGQPGTATATADIQLDGGVHNADVFQATATGGISGTATPGRDLSFASDANFDAAGSISLVASGGGTIGVGTRDPNPLDDIFQEVSGSLDMNVESSVGDGGDIRLEAGAGSAIAITGSVDLNANADWSDGGQFDQPGADAQGGTVTLLVGQGATFTAGGTVDLQARGEGESSSLAAGGRGTGGTILVGIDGGDVDIAGDLFLDASGQGGSDFGYGENAGGTGGSVTLEVLNGGSIDLISDGFRDIILLADGGGSFLREESPRGPGRGGTASLIVRDSILNAGSVTVQAAAEAGFRQGVFDGSPGRTGYTATGGDASVEFAGATLQLASLVIDSSASGGAGGSGATGGAGGAATGGNSTLLVEGGTFAVANLQVEAEADAGAGGSANSDTAGAGGAGGSGQGGNVTVEAGPGGTITLDSYELDVDGNGGQGGAGSASFSVAAGTGGAGGTGTGGTLRLATSGGTIDVVNPEGLSLFAAGAGGLGGQGGSSTGNDIFAGGEGGDGGQGTGGEVILDVAGGTINSPNGTMLDAGALGGAGGAAGPDLVGGLGAQGAEGAGAGGLVQVSVADGNGASGNASLGSTTLAAGGFSGSSFAPTGAGRVVIEDLGTVAGGLTMADLSVDLSLFSAGAPSLAGPAFSFTSTEGQVVVDGNVSISTSGDIAFSATGSGGLQAGGVVDIDTDGDLTLDHVTPALGAATIAGSSVLLDALGGITGSAGSEIRSTVGDVQIFAPTVDLGRVVSASDIFISAGGPSTILLDFAEAAEDIDLDSVGDIIVGTATAGDDFRATSGGDVSAATVVTTGLGPDTDFGYGDGSNIDIFADGGVRLDNGTAADAISLFAETGSVLSDVLLEAGGGIDVFAAVDVDIVDATAGSFISLTANSGFLDAGTLAAGTSIFGSSSGPTTITSATAGNDLDLNSGSDISILLGQAGDDFRASAGGTFDGGALTVTGLGSDGEIGYGSAAGEGSNIFVDANGNVTLDDGTAPGLIDLASTTGSIFSGGILTANQLLADAALDLALNDVFVVQSLSLSTANGSISGNSFNSDNSIFLSASADVTLADGDAGFGIFVSAGQAADLGALVAGSDVDVFAGGPLTLDSVTSALDVTLDSDGDILLGTATAGDDFRATADGTFTGTSVTATGLGADDEIGYGALSGEGSNIFVTASGDLSLDNGDAADAIRLASLTGSVLSSGLLAAGSDLVAEAAVDLLVNDADAGGLIDLFASGSIDAGALTATGPIFVVAFGDGAVVSATSGASITVDVSGAADLGTLAAGAGIDVDAGSILVAAATAAGDIDLFSDGGIDVGVAEAGDDFSAIAFGAFTGATVTATGAGADSENGDGALAGSNIFVDAVGDVRLDDGTAADGIELRSSTGSAFSGGILTADALLASAALDIALNDVVVVQDLALAATGGSISGNRFESGGGITLDASDSVTLAEADAGGSIFISADGLNTIVLGVAEAGEDIDLTSAGDIIVGTATAGDDFRAVAGGAVAATTIVTTGLGPDTDFGFGDGSNIDVDATGDLRLDNGAAADSIRLASRQGSVLSDVLLDAGAGIDVFAAVNVDIDDATAGSFVSLTANSGFLDAGTLAAGNSIFGSSSGPATIVEATAGDDIDLNSGSDITIGAAQAGDDFVASAGGTFGGGTVTVTGLGLDGEFGYGSAAGEGSNIFVDANGNLTLDDGTAPGLIDLASATGSIFSGGILTADELIADAAVDLALNDVFVVQDLALSAPGGSISGNSFNSDGSISLDTPGTVTVADVNAGLGIFVSTGQSADLGTLDAAGDINIDAPGDVTVASASAGDDFRATAGGTFTGGTVVTTGSGSDDDNDGIGDGSNIVVASSGDLRLDDATALDAIDLASSSGSIFSAGTLTAASLVEDAALDIVFNDVFVLDSLSLTATGGGISGNSFNSEGSITLVSRDAMTLTSDLDAGTFIYLETTGAGSGMALGDLLAGGDIEIFSAGAVTIGSATTTLDGELEIEAAGPVSVASADIARSFNVLAETGDITLGTVVANREDLPAETLQGFGAIALDGNVAIGSATADNIGLGARGTITAGSLVADGLVLLFADSDISLGTVTTSGLFYTGATSTLESLGGFDDFDPVAFAALPHLASGGDVAIGGPVVAGEVSLFADGAISGAGIDSDGGIELLASDGITLADASAGGPIALETTAAGGNMLLGNLDSPENIAINSAGSVDLAGATTNLRIEINAAGAVNAGALNAIIGAGATGTDNTYIDVTGASIAIQSARSSDDIDLTAGGDIQIDFAEAGDDIDVNAGGAFTGGSLATRELSAVDQTGDDRNIDVAANGDITLDSASAGSGGDLTLVSSVGSIAADSLATAQGPIDVEAGGGTISFASIDSGANVSLVARDGIAGDVLRAVGDVLLSASGSESGGAILVSTDLAAGGAVTALGTSVDLTALGDLRIAEATATDGDINLFAGQDLAIADATASQLLSALAQDLLSVTGEVVGTEIFFFSDDIAVGDSASIGLLGTTNRITVNAVGEGVTLGDADSDDSYVLGNGEFAAFHAANIDFVASGNEILTIGDLSIAGANAANPNLTGEMNIATSGDIEVIGAVAMNGTGGGNLLGLGALGDIFIDAASGSIALTDGGAVAGSLFLEADSITVASRQAAEDLVALATVEERSERLGVNDGAVNEDGYLRAGDIVLAAFDHIWVQNSGASTDVADRRGLTAGPSTITLFATGEGLVEIIVNGRESDGAGGFVTGGDLIGEVVIEGGFAEGSTINGCLISGAICPIGPEEGPTIDDFIKELFGDDDEDAPARFVRPPLLRLASLIELAGEPLAPAIDDPVTGSGNDQFWSDVPAGDGSEVDTPVTGSGREVQEDDGIDGPATGVGRERCEPDQDADEECEQPQAD